MFKFWKSRRKPEDSCQTFTIPIMENGEHTGCIIGRTKENLPEMTEEEFLRMMEGSPPPEKK